MKIVVGVVVLLICAGAGVGELQPIVHVERGYLFGATASGKWINAEETAKAIADQTTYRIYGLTQSLGEAKGSNRKAVENDLCTDTLSVSLSRKPEKTVIALAARLGMRCPMEWQCHQSSWLSHDSKRRRI
jgi:hypothetical protein